MAENRLCLAEDHPLGIITYKAPYTAGTEQRKNHPCPPGLHHSEEEEDSPATPTPCAKKGHTRGTPRDTNQAGKES